MRGRCGSTVGRPTSSQRVAIAPTCADVAGSSLGGPPKGTLWRLDARTLGLHRGGGRASRGPDTYLLGRCGCAGGGGVSAGGASRGGRGVRRGLRRGVRAAPDARSQRRASVRRSVAKDRSSGVIVSGG